MSEYFNNKTKVECQGRAGNSDFRYILGYIFQRPKCCFYESDYPFPKLTWPSKSGSHL